MKENTRAFRQGLKDGIPICLGYIAVSFTFGMAAKKIGLTSLQSILISATNLTSAGQFAALTLIEASATYIELALTQLIINLRYFLMSCSLSQKLSKDMPFYHRMFIAYGVTDEIFGISMGQKGKLNPYYNYGAILVAMPGWTAGTLLGTLSGSILPPRVMSALGIALYGMFLAIIIPPAKKNKSVMGVVLLSMGVSLLLDILPILNGLSSGFKIILLTLIIAGGAAVLFPIGEGEQDG